MANKLDIVAELKDLKDPDKIKELFLKYLSDKDSADSTEEKPKKKRGRPKKVAGKTTTKQKATVSASQQIEVDDEVETEYHGNHGEAGETQARRVQINTKNRVNKFTPNKNDAIKDSSFDKKIKRDKVSLPKRTPHKFKVQCKVCKKMFITDASDPCYLSDNILGNQFRCIKCSGTL